MNGILELHVIIDAWGIQVATIVLREVWTLQVQVREVDLASTTLDEPNMMLLLLPQSTIQKLLISQGSIIVNFETALIFLIVVIIRMDW